MHWHQVLGFVVAVTPLALIPGTSFALVGQKVITGSRRDGVLVALGTICGLLAYATLAAIGLSAVVMASAEALTVVKILGAVYLVWLGSPPGARCDPAPRRWEADTGVRRGQGSVVSGTGSGRTPSIPRPPPSTSPSSLSSSHRRTRSRRRSPSWQPPMPAWS
ncbi:LysE family translocator [Streptomyces spororaveus]|uniref:LysE family translocator n=1 Tax=Streptomyces spororaveus TaxID=284039 RepID=UPI00368D1664